MPEPYADVEGAFSYTLGGRLMWFKPPATGQLILLQRFRMQLKSVTDDVAGRQLIMSISMKTLNVIDSLFLDAADRDFTENLLITGQLQLNELMPVLSGASSQPDDDAEPAKKAVKKAAKKVTKAATRRG